jgi:hypothetical protein
MNESRTTSEDPFVNEAIYYLRSWSETQTCIHRDPNVNVRMTPKRLPPLSPVLVTGEHGVSVIRFTLKLPAKLLH